jgi:hypothetical protein
MALADSKRASIASLAVCQAMAMALSFSASAVVPNRAPAPRFDPSAALNAWRDLPIRLANLGYLGHMLAPYAMSAYDIVPRRFTLRSGLRPGWAGAIVLAKV